MSLPPKREFMACMDVIRRAILRARSWGWQSNIPAEQLTDLMDAIHNIPSLVQQWEKCDQDLLKQFLDDYDRKWATSDGPCLRAIYEEASCYSSDDHQESHDKMRVIKSDPEVLRNVAHDAINIFVRDVLIPQGLVDGDKYHGDKKIADSQINITKQVAEMWKHSQVDEES